MELRAAQIPANEPKPHQIVRRFHSIRINLNEDLIDIFEWENETKRKEEEFQWVRPDIDPRKTLMLMEIYPLGLHTQPKSMFG